MSSLAIVYPRWCFSSTVRRVFLLFRTATVAANTDESYPAFFISCASLSTMIHISGLVRCGNGFNGKEELEERPVHAVFRNGDSGRCGAGISHLCFAAAGIRSGRGAFSDDGERAVLALPFLPKTKKIEPLSWREVLCCVGVQGCLLFVSYWGQSLRGAQFPLQRTTQQRDGRTHTLCLVRRCFVSEHRHTVRVRVHRTTVFERSSPDLARLVQLCVDLNGKFVDQLDRMT